MSEKLDANMVREWRAAWAQNNADDLARYKAIDPIQRLDDLDVVSQVVDFFPNDRSRKTKDEAYELRAQLYERWKRRASKISS